MKEYGLNYIGLHMMMSARFLNQGRLGSLDVGLGAQGGLGVRVSGRLVFRPWGSRNRNPQR